MTRDEVYKVIDGERAYQAKKWGPYGTGRAVARQPILNPAGHRLSERGSGLPENYQTVGEFLVYMDHHLNEAKRLLATSDGAGPALHALRKVITLGVACAEQHGLPEREVAS